MSNLAQRKWQAFKQNRRAKISAVILLVMLFVSAISELIANDKPLIVKYKDSYLFPMATVYSDAFFGGDFKDEITISIKDEVNIPVKYVGLGEQEDDLRIFDIEKYIYGLFKGFVGDEDDEK